MAKINLSGFSNIHVCKMTKPETATEKPVYSPMIELQGAKNIEVSLSFEQVKFFADDTVSYLDNYFNGAEMTLSLSGLTLDEHELLFGNKQGKFGMTEVNAGDVAPELAFTFEKRILGTNFKRKFVIYAAKLSPSGISAETLADSVSESPIELTGTIRQLASGEIYAMVDENSKDYDNSLDNWHEEVKFMEVKPVGDVIRKAVK